MQATTPSRLAVNLTSSKVFNLFAQNSTGTLTFANLTDFANGLLTSGTDTFPDAVRRSTPDTAAGAYGNFTASGDINDAAANWKRNTFSAYVQDEWQATDQLGIVAGVRVDWLSGSTPDINQNFVDRYGFSNAVGFGKIDPVVLPRFGFTYEVDNSGFFSNTQIKGGLGRFTGGDPAVYFSNAFSNNGFAVGSGRTGHARPAARLEPSSMSLRAATFTGVPDCVVAAGGAQSAGGLADTQSTDPDFKMPTVLRANLGLSTMFGTESGFFSDWRLNLDFIYSKFVDPVDFVDLSQVVDTRLGLNGFTVDGRPIYRAIDPTATGCNAVLQDQGGIPPTYTGVTAACFSTGRDDEIQLTNGKSFESKIASVIVSKFWNRGILTDGGSVNFNLGYAYTDAENNRYSSSSTATSSFDIVAAFDRQNVDVANGGIPDEAQLHPGPEFPGRVLRHERNELWLRVRRPFGTSVLDRPGQREFERVQRQRQRRLQLAAVRSDRTNRSKRRLCSWWWPNRSRCSRRA